MLPLGELEAQQRYPALAIKNNDIVFFWNAARGSVVSDNHGHP
jgi:hypothetical protein